MRTDPQIETYEETALLTRAIDSAPDAFVSIDADGLITAWNQSGQQLFGWSAAEVVGRELTEVIVPPHLRHQHANGVRRAVVTGESAIAGRRLGLTGLHRDGSEIPLEVTIWPSEGSDGPRFHAHLRDARPEAQQRRAPDGSPQLHQVADAVPGVVYTFVLEADGSSRFPFVSAACEELYGFPAEEAMADSSLMLGAVHPDDRAAFDRAGRHSTATAAPMTWDGRIVRRDGSLRWVTVSSRSAPLASGGTRWYGVVADTTPAHAAEELIASQSSSLAEERTMLAATLRNLSDAVVACDAEGRLTLFNAAAEQLHGRTASAAVPAEEWPRAYDLVDPDSGRPLDPAAIPLLRVLRGESVVDVPIDVVPAGRPARRVACTGQQLRTPDGRLLGAVVTMRDDTELLAAHEGLTARYAELQRADQLKSDLMGMLGHEISTPLTTILGYAEEAGALLGEPGREAVVRRALATVERNARRLDALHREILALVALDAGRLTATPQEVPVREHLRSAALLAREPGRIAIDCDRDLVCLVQPSHLDQVLSNLVINADKYAGGVCWMGARADGDRVEVTVRDDGPGVPPGFRDHLFQRFSRADATAHGVRGTGLGLFIVRELVAANGGRVEYREAPSGGSDFVVELPRSTG